MTTLPRCICCAGALADPAERYRAWCYPCADAVLDAVLRLRDGKPATIGMRVAWLQDNDEPFLAQAIVGPLPFSDEREA